MPWRKLMGVDGIACFFIGLAATILAGCGGGHQTTTPRAEQSLLSALARQGRIDFKLISKTTLPQGSISPDQARKAAIRAEGEPTARPAVYPGRVSDRDLYWHGKPPIPGSQAYRRGHSGRPGTLPLDRPAYLVRLTGMKIYPNGGGSIDRKSVHRELDVFIDPRTGAEIMSTTFR